MMYGPSNVDTSEAETAGIIMSFFLQVRDRVCSNLKSLLILS